METTITVTADLPHGTPPNEWSKSYAGDPRYDHIDNGVGTPDDGRWLWAAQSGWYSVFELADIPADHIITQINYHTRIKYAAGMGASTWALWWKIKKNSTDIDDKYILPGTILTPTNINAINSGLSIASNDLNLSQLHLYADGTGWGFFQAIIQLSEIDLVIQHQTAAVETEPVEVLAPIAPQIEVVSPIEAIEVLSPITASLEVDSPIQETIEVLAPIPEESNV